MTLDRLDSVAGQTPAWLSIVTGVLGVLGTLGAQWLATRRDDKRWEREYKKEVDKRDHETKMSWREQRRIAYGQLLGILNVWYSGILINAQLIERREPLDEHFIAELKKMEVESSAVFGQVQLVGTEKTSDLAFTYVTDMLWWSKAVRNGKMPHIGSHTDSESLDHTICEYIEDSNRTQEKNYRSRRSFRHCATSLRT